MFNLTWQHEIYKVSGQSMEKENICHGDFVVIDEREPIKNGDLVVALLSNKTSIVKHVERIDSHLKFYPFHEKNPWMFIDDAKIQGKVVAIIKA